MSKSLKMRLNLCFSQRDVGRNSCGTEGTVAVKTEAETGISVVQRGGKKLEKQLEGPTLVGRTSMLLL